MSLSPTKVRSVDFPTTLPSAVCPQAGFAGIELVLGLAILLLVGWLGILLVGEFQHRHRCRVLADDLLAFAHVLESVPAPGVQVASAPVIEPGRLPAEFETRLAGTNWAHGSPFGGNYEWLAPSVSMPPANKSASPATKAAAAGAIGVTAFAPQAPLTATRADLLRVDRMIDDGNLHTGRFRLGFNGWPCYRLERR